jgi:hypothetical protein
LKVRVTVDALGLVPNLTYPIVQFYVVGDTPPTAITLNNNNSTPELPVAVYAPHSNVSIENHATIRGGIAANRVTMSNNSAVLNPGTSLGDLVTNITPVYRVNQLTECSATPPAAGQPPDHGC